MATAISYVSVTRSHRAVVHLETTAGAGSAVTLSAASLAAATFGTPFGGSLGGLYASQLYRALNRPYPAAADAIAAGLNLFNVTVMPTNDLTGAANFSASTVTTDGIHFRPVLLVTCNAVNCQYDVQITCPNSITR